MEFNKKYRPKNFDTVFGNVVTVNMLSVLVDNGTVPHAILIAGDNGVGKTTLARILAEKLNAYVVEHNCGSEGGIDDIRNIIKSAPFKTFNGGNKLFILDEAHGISKDGQKALLKSLEEPPSHVYFVLCTTEPNKLLSAIKTRCSPFNVTSLTKEESSRLINYITIEENIEIDEDAKEYIIDISLGIPRDIVKYLDMFCKTGDVSALYVEQTEKLNTLIRALKSNSWCDVLTAYKGLGKPAEEIRHSIVSYCEKSLVYNPHSSPIFFMDIMNTFLVQLHNSNPEAHMLSLMYSLYKNRRN